MFAFTQPTLLLQIKTILSLLIMQIQYAQERAIGMLFCLIIIEKKANQSSHYKLFIITSRDNKKLICFDTIASIDFVVLVVGKIFNFSLWTKHKL